MKIESVGLTYLPILTITTLSSRCLFLKVVWSFWEGLPSFLARYNTSDICCVLSPTVTIHNNARKSCSWRLCTGPWEMLMVTDFMVHMWNYTVAWCAVTEQQAKKPYQKCQGVYTTFTDQQQTSAAESGNAAMHVPVMTELYQWWRLVLIRISQQQHWGYQITPTLTLEH